MLNWTRELFPLKLLAPKSANFGKNKKFKKFQNPKYFVGSNWREGAPPRPLPSPNPLPRFYPYIFNQTCKQYEYVSSSLLTNSRPRFYASYATRLIRLQYNLVPQRLSCTPTALTPRGWEITFCCAHSFLIFVFTAPFCLLRGDSWPPSLFRAEEISHRPNRQIVQVCFRSRN